jgi:hypothetical protein
MCFEWVLMRGDGGNPQIGRGHADPSVICSHFQREVLQHHMAQATATSATH